MAFILSLETSTQVCSVALHEGDRLITTSEVHIEQSHASRLAVLIQQNLIAGECEAKDLHAVAVSAGPGSYTGLRIGTSLAKGMCFSLDIPLISIETLDLLASQVSQMVNFEDHLLCPMIDARRMEVYCSVMDLRRNVILPVESRVIDEESFADLLVKRKIIFFGNGAEKCKTTIKHENAIFFDGLYPKASAMGPLAFSCYAENSFEDLSSYEPFYLKSFIAKRPKTLI
ncbi:MAG TPA: tRNA (adenosine(37)-N6)-threonylcarbamoyltransferase complex dimerization subunit type 1 TsaB [Cyclobacteriaceae bacterium]|nr:tRNA (adenosine(37)-N6)-threonylcarbamoyltransferase complex dimerization subunit type 1 TsaB [Cyclobacteriaceae bacterium]